MMVFVFRLRTWTAAMHGLQSLHVKHVRAVVQVVVGLFLQSGHPPPEPKPLPDPEPEPEPQIPLYGLWHLIRPQF